MKGAEFERRVRKLAWCKKVACQFVAGNRMFAFTYPAKFAVGSDGRVLVEFVDLPRVATDGKDECEAFEEAMDALGSELSIRLSRREEIPAASAARHSHRLVPVPLWLAPKLALYLAMRDQEVNNYGFKKAFPQSCLTHLIRRCRDLLALSSPAAGQFASQVKGLLQPELCAFAGARLRSAA